MSEDGRNNTKAQKENLGFKDQEELIYKEDWVARRTANKIGSKEKSKKDLDIENKRTKLAHKEATEIGQLQSGFRRRAF